MVSLVFSTTNYGKLIAKEKGNQDELRHQIYITCDETVDITVLYVQWRINNSKVLKKRIFKTATFFKNTPCSMQ